MTTIQALIRMRATARRALIEARREERRIQKATNMSPDDETIYDVYIQSTRLDCWCLAVEMFKQYRKELGDEA
jgi:hypothetical protein